MAVDRATNVQPMKRITRCSTAWAYSLSSMPTRHSTREAAATSIQLSAPKKTSAKLPATIPDQTAIVPSATL